MPTPEEKYYDSMNTLLAPVRWVKSLVQTVIIILLLIGAGLLYPLIQLVNSGHVTFGGLGVCFLTALFIFTFFYAPWYTVIGGIVAFVLLLVLTAFDSLLEIVISNFGIFVLGFLLLGILQRFLRHRLFDPPKEPKPKQLSFVEQLNQDIRERNEQATAQTAFEGEHRDTIETMKEFVSLCRQPLEESLRGRSVLSGDTLVNADEAILMDIWQIWRRLEMADGNFCVDGPQRLLKALCCVVEPRFITASDWEMLMCDLYPTLAAQDTASPLGLPGAVSMLTLYDVRAGTQHASKSAATYRTVLTSIAALRNNSFALRMVIDEYLKVLKPYLNDGNAGSASQSYGVDARKSTCEECANAYRLLDLQLGASDGEVKAKKHAFAELFHADRLAAMSESARRIAQEQHASVNGACDHILRDCKVRERTDSGINGSEPSPAHQQSTREATTAEKTTEHQPAPASSDMSEVVRQENRNKVPTDEELIEAIDATRRRVEASTKRMEEFLEDLKRRRRRSLE